MINDVWVRLNIRPKHWHLNFFLLWPPYHNTVLRFSISCSVCVKRPLFFQFKFLYFYIVLCPSCSVNHFTFIVPSSLSYSPFPPSPILFYLVYLHWLLFIPPSFRSLSLSVYLFLHLHISTSTFVFFSSCCVYFFPSPLLSPSPLFSNWPKLRKNPLHHDRLSERWIARAKMSKPMLCI